jgi:hypothetical protein
VAGLAGFGPAIFSVTGKRGRPDSPIAPQRPHTESNRVQYIDSVPALQAHLGAFNVKLHVPASLPSGNMSLKVKDLRWFRENILNILPDTEVIVMSTGVYASLRISASMEIDPILEPVLLKGGNMGTLFGKTLKISTHQPSHLVTVYRRGGKVNTLCDHHGWGYEETCTYGECIVKWVHSR